ncbi:hypothetical protein BHE74_00004328 [Ensete ventricosum]|nr:hypothetical protein BHE74_00004328 [Ensete ventricosum]
MICWIGTIPVCIGITNIWYTDMNCVLTLCADVLQRKKNRDKRKGGGGTKEEGGRKMRKRWRRKKKKEEAVVKEKEEEEEEVGAYLRRRRNNSEVVVSYVRRGLLFASPNLAYFPFLTLSWLGPITQSSPYHNVPLGMGGIFS